MPAPQQDLDELLATSRRLAEAGRGAESVGLLRRAVEAGPAEEELLFAAALATLEVAPDEAKSYLRCVVENSREDARQLTRVAAIMVDLMEYDEDREYVRRASRNIPEDFELSAVLVHIAGRLALQKGDEQLAERLLSSAFEDDPVTPGHGRILADFLASRGELERARQVAEEALQRLPRDPSLVSLRAELTR